MEDLDDDVDMADCPLCEEAHPADLIPSEDDGRDADCVVFPCDEVHHWVYCDLCEEWTSVGRYGSARWIRLGGVRQFVCDLGEHELVICENCDRVIYNDDARTPCDDAGTFCETCFSNRGGCGCYECSPTPRGSAGGRNPYPQRHCPQCNTTDYHVDLLTERFLCDCEARARKRKDVLLRRPLLVLVPT